MVYLSVLRRVVISFRIFRRRAFCNAQFVHSTACKQALAVALRPLHYVLPALPAAVSSCARFQPFRN